MCVSLDPGEVFAGEGEDQVVIRFPEEVDGNGTLNLSFSYMLVPPSDALSLGFYVSNTTGTSSVGLQRCLAETIAPSEVQKSWCCVLPGCEPGENIAIAQLQAIFARSAFPCFDEPEFKVRVLLRLMAVIIANKEI